MSNKRNLVLYVDSKLVEKFIVVREKLKKGINDLTDNG
jgi:hypothetical protein